MHYSFCALSERPDKVAETLTFTESIRNPNNAKGAGFGWPVFEFQSDSGKIYWTKLHQDFAAYQFCLLDEQEQVIASCFAIPFDWDGTNANLPAGWDSVMAKGFQDRAQGIQPNALSLLAITVSQAHQGQGLSKLILERVKAYVKQQQLDYLVAPVRPVLKQFYPLTSITDYADWKTKEGKVFDPWLRVHLGMGASLVKFAPQSLTIAGTVADWEGWAGMKFPVSGEYVVSGALSTVQVSVEQDQVTYYQPNIWLQHDLN
jgi:GNAT superfamily N-acetyltransferase